jgi:hypothetical protein
MLKAGKIRFIRSVARGRKTGGKRNENVKIYSNICNRDVDGCRKEWVKSTYKVERLQKYLN